ncbi:MAG TPA: hypothetical protein VHF89_08420 [Solirubrobacteraceae bacterium]|nr:hypothetical protein [Solirubrobacteraceae bacterium]
MATDRQRRARRAGLATASLVAFLAFATAPPAAARSCVGAECGVPSCWISEAVKVRPDMARTRTVYCSNALAAEVTTPPQHGELSGVFVDWRGLHFTMRADADAPRHDSAVVTLEGHEQPLELELDFEVVPPSENGAPVCEGDTLEQRSDGSTPLELFLHPWCYDPDDDEFVVEGGGPGVHRESPLSVEAGDGMANWHYETATSSGNETTAIWATDVLGARSADATLDVTIGPGVDERPACHPSTWSTPFSEHQPIYSRPGAIRRFTIICEDADGDAFTTSLDSPPQHGVLALLPPSEPSHGWWGVEQFISATYVPAGTGTERDEFTLTPSGERGAGFGDMVVVPREPPENGGGGCGWSPHIAYESTPTTLRFSCDDDDGDPLTATVVGQPLHGTAGPATVVDGVVSVPYVPEQGYQGYDCVKVTVTDGYGLDFEITIDITVRPRPMPVPDPDPPVLPVDPPTPPIDPPTPPIDPPLPDPNLTAPPAPLPPARPAAKHGTGTAQPASAAVVVAAAQEVLASDEIRPLVLERDAQVWAAPRISKRDLLRDGRAAGLYVVCPDGCTLRASSSIVIPKRSSRPREIALAAAPARPSVLWVAPTRAERRRLRRARRARARFELAIGDARPAGYAIPIGR